MIPENIHNYPVEIPRGSGEESQQPKLIRERMKLNNANSRGREGSNQKSFHHGELTYGYFLEPHNNLLLNFENLLLHNLQNVQSNTV